MKLSIIALTSLLAALTDIAMAAPAATPDGATTERLEARGAPFGKLERCHPPGATRRVPLGYKCPNGECAFVKANGEEVVQFTCDSTTYDLWPTGELYKAGGDGQVLAKCKSSTLTGLECS